jgi:hypothetical protein
MTATPKPVAENESRRHRPVTLWNLQENLARLADELADAARKYDEASSGEVTGGPVLEDMTPHEYFSSLLELRRTRERYFGSELFGEPAWDVMLELMLARIDARDVKASELRAFEGTPGAAARHYLEALLEARLVESFDNAENLTDSFLSLSSEAARRMAELYRARMRG